MRNFREEMRRSMGRGMIAAMLMTMFPMLLAVLRFLPDIYTERHQSSSLIVNALYKSGLTPVTFIAAAFAYSTSYISDLNSGALRYQMARCGRTRFAVDRFCANAICGALGVIGGEAIFYLLLRTVYPVEDIPYRFVEAANAMEALSYARPELYYFIMMLVRMPSYMFMASVALAVSTLVKNVYVTLASPMIYVGLSTALPKWSSGYRVSQLIYTPGGLDLWTAGYAEYGWHLAYCAVGLIVTFAVFYVGVRRYKGE